METVNRYTSEEILAIFQANYLQQQQFDEVEPDEKLTFDTTIGEWRNICNLLKPHELANYFNYFFELDISMEEWISVLQPQTTKNLKETCEFIAKNAVKPLIKPVNLFGSDCSTAATFKFLMNRFATKGVDIKEIKPSSLLEPFSKKYLALIIEEVNKLNSSVLPAVVYKDNLIKETAFYVFLVGFLLLIASIWVHNLVIPYISFFAFGLLLVWVGSKYKPANVSFEGIITFRDLIIKIENNRK